MSQPAERRPTTLSDMRGKRLAQSLRKLSEYQLPSKQEERAKFWQFFEEEEKKRLEGSGGEPREAEKKPKKDDSGSDEDEDENLEGLTEEQKAKREAKRKKRERQRKAVLSEIVTTEKAYVDNLSILMRHFYRPLVDAAAESGKSSLKKSKKVQLNEENIPILRPDDLQKIFANLEAIYQKHVSFLEKLEEREKAWKEDEKEDRIGDVFYLGTQFFIMYSPYVLNYDKSLETVQTLMTEKRFSSYIHLICGHPELKGLDLSNYLIMPVQRLPRYILLLTELVKYTPKKHADYSNLQRCLANVKAAAEVCNTRKDSTSGKKERPPLRRRASTMSNLGSAMKNGHSTSEKESPSLDSPRSGEKGPSKGEVESPATTTTTTTTPTTTPTKTPAPSSAPAKMQRSKSNRGLKTRSGSAISHKDRHKGREGDEKRRNTTVSFADSPSELQFLLQREEAKDTAGQLYEREVKTREKRMQPIDEKGQISAFFVEPTALPSARGGLVVGQLSSYGLGNL